MTLVTKEYSFIDFSVFLSKEAENHSFENEFKHLNSSRSDWESNEEIQIFREYLRIRTDHPDIDYGISRINKKKK